MSPLQNSIDQYYEVDILCREEEEGCLKKDIQTFVLYKFDTKPFDFSSQEVLDKKYREEYELLFINSILRYVFD